MQPLETRLEKFRQTAIAIDVAFVAAVPSYEVLMAYADASRSIRICAAVICTVSLLLSVLLSQNGRWRLGYRIGRGRYGCVEVSQIPLYVQAAYEYRRIWIVVPLYAANFIWMMGASFTVDFDGVIIVTCAVFTILLLLIVQVAITAGYNSGFPDYIRTGFAEAINLHIKFSTREPSERITVDGNVFGCCQTTRPTEGELDSLEIPQLEKQYILWCLGIAPTGAAAAAEVKVAVAPPATQPQKKKSTRKSKKSSRVAPVRAIPPTQIVIA